MSQFGLLKSGEIHRKWDQSTRDHGMPVGRSAQRIITMCGQESCLSHYALYLLHLPTVPGPWQVIAGYFISSKSNYDIRSRRIFLELSWKYLLLLSQPIPPLPIALVKTGRLPLSSAAAFSLSPGSHKRGLYEVISPSFLNFLLAQTKATFNSLLQETFMEHAVNQIGMWALIELSHTPTNLENLVISIVELLSRVLCVTGVQRRRIVNG